MLKSALFVYIVLLSLGLAISYQGTINYYSVFIKLFSLFIISIILVFLYLIYKFEKINTHFIPQIYRKRFKILLRINKFVRKSPSKIFFILSLVISIIWIFWGLFYTSRLEQPNEVGDSFGAINTLFSGFAFVGVIVAIILQSKELKAQREELSQTRQELKGQKEELALQNRISQIARFESSFFIMLSSHREILKNLYYDNKHGIDAIHDIEEKFKSKITTSKKDTDYYDSFLVDIENINGRLEYIIKMFKKFKPIYYCDSYFRYMYRIIKFVDSNKILNEEEKSDYIDLLRAQISRDEFVLVFYNSLMPEYKKMKKYIVKYRFFDNFQFDTLSMELDIFLYPKEAFGEEWVEHIISDIINSTPHYIMQPMQEKLETWKKEKIQGNNY